MQVEINEKKEVYNLKSELFYLAGVVLDSVKQHLIALRKLLNRQERWAIYQCTAREQAVWSSKIQISKIWHSIYRKDPTKPFSDNSLVHSFP